MKKIPTNANSSLLVRLAFATENKKTTSYLKLKKNDR